MATAVSGYTEVSTGPSSTTVSPVKVRRVVAVHVAGPVVGVRGRGGPALDQVAHPTVDLPPRDLVSGTQVVLRDEPRDEVAYGRQVDPDRRVALALGLEGALPVAA